MRSKLLCKTLQKFGVWRKEKGEKEKREEGGKLGGLVRATEGEKNGLKVGRTRIE